MNDDPIGPGTPAWTQGDRAIGHYKRAKKHSMKDKEYRAYCNHRQLMLRCLERAGAEPKTIENWRYDLLRMARDPAFDYLSEED